MENRIKKIPLRYWLGGLCILGLLIAYLLQRCNSEQIPAGGFIADKIETYKDKLGETRAKVETTQGGGNSAFYKSEIERLTTALNVKEKDLINITAINAQLRDSVKLAKVTTAPDGFKEWQWQKQTESGSTIAAKMSERDSVLHSEIDVKLQTTDYVQRGGLFKANKYFTDIYSPDQNITINGVRTYRQEVKVKRKPFGVGAFVGYGIGANLKPSPFVGFGLTYDLFSF